MLKRKESQSDGKNRKATERIAKRRKAKYNLTGPPGPDTINNKIHNKQKQ